MNVALAIDNVGVPRWVERYIGIPYAERGHDFGGCNCWGLCHLVLGREAEIQTDPYAEISAADFAAVAKKFQISVIDGTWIPVIAVPRAFDCVLMTAMTEEPRPRRYPGHVGIMISTDHLLHVWEATAAVAMAINLQFPERSHPSIRHRVLGAYRHRDLA